MTHIIGQEPIKIRIHKVEVPIPTEDARKLLAAAVVEQRDELTGLTSRGLAITWPTMALWIETRDALAERDRKIEALERKVEILGETLVEVLGRQTYLDGEALRARLEAADRPPVHVEDPS